MSLTSCVNSRSSLPGSPRARAHPASRRTAIEKSCFIVPLLSRGWDVPLWPGKRKGPKRCAPRPAKPDSVTRGIGDALLEALVQLYPLRKDGGFPGENQCRHSRPPPPRRPPVRVVILPPLSAPTITRGRPHACTPVPLGPGTVTANRTVIP